MNAGDRHTVNKRSNRVMDSKTHHRDMDHITIAKLLQGTERKGNNIFYNNVLSDIVASYVAFRADNNYDKLLKIVFQDKGSNALRKVLATMREWLAAQIPVLRALLTHGTQSSSGRSNSSALILFESFLLI